MDAHTFKVEVKITQPRPQTALARTYVTCVEEDQRIRMALRLIGSAGPGREI